MNKTTYETVSIKPNYFASILHFTPEMIESNVDYDNKIYHTQTEYFIPPHWHRALEFTYVKKGHLKLRINGSTEQITSGDFLLVNSGELHELHSIDHEEFDVQCLIISYPLLKKLIPDFYTYTFKLDKGKQSYNALAKKFEMIMKLNAVSDDLSYLKLNSIILDLVYDLMKDHSKRKNKKSMENQEFIIGVLDYIHFNYNKEITLQTISNDFGMSREHFSRLFKSSVGSSFLQYLTDYRIYQAFPEIIKSDKTVESISRKHGFSNTKSLISQFKKRYGDTPIQFRKNQSISIIDHNDDNF